MHSFYLDAIRNFEGYTPQAKWDYAQHSNGYGTRARHVGEVIDRVEAERRFQTEVSSARSIVEKAVPGLDEGTKAALTSLTYNAGTSWIDSGLGDAVRRGDLDTARDIFQKYNKAGGEVLPGLVNRRSQEALWIGNPGAVTGATNVALNTDGTGAMPPVLMDRDQSARAVADMIRAQPAPSAGTAARSGSPFERAPGTERVALNGTLGNAASEALMALISREGLAFGGTAEAARIAQLNRGSELAGTNKDEKETRRV
jgi:lysozyme